MMPEFSSWRTNVGNGLAHSVIVVVFETVVVVVGALTVVVVWVAPIQEQALE